jgi:hypothetical protein
MTLSVAVILRCRSEAKASKGGGVALRQHLGRTSFEARKSSHLRMTGL